jgi:hypothetical protein
MSDSAQIPVGPAAHVESERFRLARLAREAALLVPGVTGTDTGPIGVFITVGGGERLEGVVCVATKDGGYEVTLRLVCALVPLLELSEQVKAAVRQTAVLAGIPLESVSVYVAGVAAGGEL